MSSPLEQVESDDDHPAKRVKEEHHEENEMAALNESFEEERKQINEKIIRLQEQTKRLQEQTKRLQEGTKRLRNLRKGVYYATFDEVWEPTALPFTSEDYEAMIRTGFPDFETLNNNNQMMKCTFRATWDQANELAVHCESENQSQVSM